jgi:hypothetical protein
MDTGHFRMAMQSDSSTNLLIADQTSVPITAMDRTER